MPKPLPALFLYFFFNPVGPSIWDEMQTTDLQLYKEVFVVSDHRMGTILKYLFGGGGGGKGLLSSSMNQEFNIQNNG